MGAIQSHYGESIIRARFTDYIQRFVRIASRYEEETASATTIGFPCAAYNPAAPAAGYGAQASLGTGVVFADEATGVRELVANAARIERWMQTASYRLYQRVRGRASIGVSSAKLIERSTARLSAKLCRTRRSPGST